MDFLGSLISAGANLLGGWMGQSNQQRIAQQNIQAQQEFAQHGIQWKVDDARRAGINPLVALGANTSSFSNIAGSNDLGAGVSAAGQDVGRAAHALMPDVIKERDLKLKLLEAQIANVNSDTAKQMQIASNMALTHASPGTGPGVPLPREDPRGPVIPLMQRAYDARTGEYVWIPSEKAASPLQTLGAMPTNAALAGRAATEGLAGYSGSGINWGVPDWLSNVRPDVMRNVTSQSLQAMY